MREIKLLQQWGLRLCVALLCSGLFVFFVQSTQPKFSSVLLTGDAPSHSLSLPFNRENAPEGPFSIDFAIMLPPLHATVFSVLPDDCIDSITIDGRAVVASALPFCDAQHPRRISFAGLVHSGINHVHIAMRNLGWNDGLDISVSWTDWTYLSGFIGISFVLFWFFMPLLIKKKRRNLFASWTHWKQRHRHCEKILTALCITIGTALIITILARGTYMLAARIWYELQGPFTDDSPLYWAVGRGILNGLMPYSDLFESKPPGIFLLSALSFKIFNGPLLGTIIQALLLGIYPMLSVAFAWSFSTQHHLRLWQRWTVVLFSFAMGIHLALYSSERSGEYQVESFGAGFATMYLTLAVWPRKIPLIRISLFGAFLLLCSIGMKEPFLLTIIASVLLLALQQQGLFIRFMLSLIIAALSGIIALFMLGYLHSYLTIYVFGEIFGHYVPISELSPWLTMFYPQRLWLDLSAFSSWFTFGLGASVIGMIVLNCGNKQQKWYCFWNLCICVIASALTSFAVGMSGLYYNHLFIFSVPLLYGIFLALLLSFQSNKWRKMRSLFLVTLTALLCCNLFLITIPDYYPRIVRTSNSISKMRTFANTIDNVLTTCNEDRYLFLGGNGAQPYGFTHHSPIGPLFAQYPWLLGSDRKFFRSAFLEQIHTAKVIVFNAHTSGNLQNTIEQILQTQFTTDPWPCASFLKPEDIPSGYRILFRKN